jgi:hypothetical protein
MNYDMLLFFFHVRRMGMLNPGFRVQELPQPVHVKDSYHCFLNQIKLSLYPNLYPTNINFDPNT